MSDQYVLSFFDLCDEDRDGYITIEELKRVFKDKKFDEKFMQEYLHLFDKNKDGRISRQEYAETISKISPKDREVSLWWSIFEMFDQDHDGFITMDEVKAVLGDISNKGIKYTVSDFEKFLKAYDANNDGKIDYSEFIQFLKGKQ